VIEEPPVQCEEPTIQNRQSILTEQPVDIESGYENDDLEPADVDAANDISAQSESIVDESFTACEPLLLPDQCNLLQMKLREADSAHLINDDGLVAERDAPVAQEVVTNVFQNKNYDVAQLEMFSPVLKVDEGDVCDSPESVAASLSDQSSDPPLEDKEEEEAIENLEDQEEYEEVDEYEEDENETDEVDVDETGEDDDEYEEVEGEEETDDDDENEYEYVYEYEYVDEDPSAEEGEWVEENENPESEDVEEVTDSWDDSVEQK